LRQPLSGGRKIIFPFALSGRRLLFQESFTLTWFEGRKADEALLVVRPIPAGPPAVELKLPVFCRRALATATICWQTIPGAT